MSYDFQLRRENNLKEPLNTDCFQKLEDDFVVKNLRVINNDKVVEFVVKFKNNQPNWIEDGFKFVWQDKGYYWAYISYSANEKMFNYFHELTEEVAEALGLTIFNPQFETEDGKSVDRDTQAAKQRDKQRKEWINKTLDGAANFEFDYRLFILSDDPESGYAIHLYENGENLYRGTVHKGEILRDRLKPTVEILTSSTNYEVINLVRVDKTLSQEITNNPLVNVTIKIPYFEPKSRNLKHNMVWVGPESDIN